MWVARDLLLYDPPRVLAWRFLHDPRLAAVPAWLAPLVPRPAESLDRDPVALLLGAAAVLLAIAYLVAALGGVRAALRGAIVGAGAVLLVVAPTAAFVAMGVATARPYGQDGGVVQVPLAMDKILAGESPYGADYADSILGKEARVSDFWSAHGGNPILRHHAYLPGTHLLMLAPYLACRALSVVFDPRLVTLLAYGVAILLVTRLVADPALRLAAAALVAVNPLVYWHQVFGANDVMPAALVLLALFFAARHRPGLAAAALGLACGTKQLAWPYAPFLLVHLAGLRSLRDLVSRAGLRRLARPVLIATAVFVTVVAPIAALDFGRFWGDIVAYNVGLPGADNYPLGGTPGFGFANLLIYGGWVASLKDYFPFGVFYVLLVPVGLFLLRRQMRDASAGSVLVTGSAALLASLYFSRVVHPNYLILPAILLPVGVLMGAGRLGADVVAVPLLLLSLGAEVSDHELFRSAWEDGLAVRLPQHLSGAAALLAPRAGPGLTQDPLGLVISAMAAGIAVVYLVGGLAGWSVRARQVLLAAALVVLVAVPTLVVVKVGQATGLVRGQDAWLGSYVRERPALQAWSTSFRRDSPSRLLAEDAPPAFGARWLGSVGPWDPRGLSLAALALTAFLLVRSAAPELRPLALGAALLSPAAAVGVAFGAPGMFLLAAALGLWALGSRGGAVAAAATLALLTAAGSFPGSLEPGVGLPNLLLYWGVGTPAFAALCWWAAGLVAIAGVILWWRLRGGYALLAAVLLAVLFMANGASPHALAVPCALLAFEVALAPAGTPDASS